MKCIEYGSEHAPVMVLLHGGGLSWWNYRTAAQQLSAHYHVVLPVLDGHGTSETRFDSIEDSARHLLQWIHENFGGHVLLLGGLSLGAQIAVEMLSQQGSVCDYALLESPSLIPDRLTQALIAPVFGASYGLISQKWFARLQFRSLHLPEELFDDYYRDTCRITKDDLISFMRSSTGYQLPDALSGTSASLRIVVGGKESPRMKRSAQLLHNTVPGSILVEEPGLYHGEYSMKDSQCFAQELMDWMTAQS